MVTTAVAATVPAFYSEAATPIAVGVALAVIGAVAWSLLTGAIPPLFIGALGMLVTYGAVILFGSPPPVFVLVGAAGLYLTVELVMRSLELRQRHTGWQTFGAADGFLIGATAVGVGATTWLVSEVGQGAGESGGAFLSAVGIAAAAAVIGVVWLLARRE